MYLNLKTDTYVQQPNTKNVDILQEKQDFHLTVRCVMT
jgi:hypothetical protein